MWLPKERPPPSEVLLIACDEAATWWMLMLMLIAREADGMLMLILVMIAWLCRSDHVERCWLLIAGKRSNVHNLYADANAECMQMGRDLKILEFCWLLLASLEDNEARDNLFTSCVDGSILLVVLRTITFLHRVWMAPWSKWLNLLYVVFRTITFLHRVWMLSSLWWCNLLCVVFRTITFLHRVWMLSSLWWLNLFTSCVDGSLLMSCSGQRPFYIV